MKKELQKRLLKFRDDRYCKKFYSAQNLSHALMVEVGELEQLFLWRKNEKNLKHIALEIADVQIYLFYLADLFSLDLDKVVEMKIHQNRKKYPKRRSSSKYGWKV